jgi:N-acylneuraminate cytidylyltransferase
MATAPFLTEKIIQKGYQLLINSKVDSVTPVVQYSFPIQRAVLIKDERLIIRWPENYSLRSQDCEPHYHEAGLFDFGRVDAIKKEKRLPCSHASAIIIPESMAQDVDTEEDWKLAEFKYQYISGDRA